MRPSAARLIPLVLLAALGALLLGGCGGGPAATDQLAVGVVTNVEGTSLTNVTGFTLRTDDGRSLTFTIGALTADADSFPAQHLHEHQADGERVQVTYQVKDGKNVASRLSDAPEPGAS